MYSETPPTPERKRFTTKIQDFWEEEDKKAGITGLNNYTKTL